MNTKLMFSNKSNEWSTPQAFFNELDKEFHFTLDPCCTHENAKCANYYTVVDDGLSKSWFGHVVFCNPPYGRELSKWVKKCHDEAMFNNSTVVMLVPSRTDTAWFHEYIYGKAEIRFLRGRLKFGNSTNPAPFPSMVVVFNNNF